MQECAYTRLSLFSLFISQISFISFFPFPCQNANVDSTNYRYQSPLMTVAEKSLPHVAVDMTRHLIKKKATLTLVDNRHRTALHAAVLNRQAHLRSIIVKELLTVRQLYYAT